MKAYLILEDNIKNISSKRLARIETDSVIILTDRELYREFKNKLIGTKLLLIDLFAEENGEEKAKLTQEIMEKLLNSNPCLNWSGYDLSDILVNQVFYQIEIILNCLNSMERIIKEYSITNLQLYCGNPKIQFMPLTLSEGERAFRFLYKRAWFLNWFVNEAFKDKLTIEWKNRTPATFLRFICTFRPLVIVAGKIVSMFKRAIKKSNNMELDKSELDRDKPIAVLLVRNPIQVDPLTPIYQEIQDQNEFVPMFVTFENYSNNRLSNVVKDKKLRQFDLYKNLTYKTFIGLVKDIINFRKQNKNEVIISIENNGSMIPFYSNELFRNLLPFTIDIFLLVRLLDGFAKNRRVGYLINNETHSYHSATQAEWSRKNGCLAFGIQHVSIANKLLPKISRVDTMFVMEKGIKDQLSLLKPDENFVYLGPLGYDQHFNTSTHKDKFKNISIFTQPDDFKKEYFQIIEDVMSILNDMNIDAQVNIKLHPRERDLDAFLKYEKKYSTVKIVSSEFSSNELIKNSDLVISIHSAVIMQAIISGTPTISMNYDKKHKINLNFINHDVTQKVTSKQELKTCLLNLDTLNKEYYINRKLFFHVFLEDYDGNAAKKVYDYISREVEQCNIKRGF